MSESTSRYSGALAGLALGAAALLLCLFISTTTALAGTIANDRPLLFSFDGSGSSIGAFTTAGPLSIDQSNGDVYVANLPGRDKGPGPDDAERVVCKFDAEGNAQPFSASGKSCLDGGETPGGAFGVEGFFVGASRADIAVDNSSGSGGPGEGEQGRIYVAEEGGPIHAFSPSGGYRWTLPSTSARPCGIAVDPEGHLWVSDGNAVGSAKKKVLEFASSGSPPAQIGEFAVTGEAANACDLVVDASGADFYLATMTSSGDKGLDKYVAGAYDSTLVSSTPTHVAIDQAKASGHVFGVFGSAGGFGEYEPCTEAGCGGKTVPGSPFGTQVLAPAELAEGIDYNSAKDWVYVSDPESNVIKVFGSVTSGQAPDTTGGKTDEITRTEATAHGAINPQGLPSSYRFEYKRCKAVECKTESDLYWDKAKSVQAGCEPPPPLPQDSASHPISCRLGGLSRNSWYQVRLVGINSENHLSEYSAPDTFKTLPPPVPALQGCSVSSITISSAHLGGCTIQTEEDETTWKVLLSARVGASQAQCEALGESEFGKVKEGTIPSGEAAPVGIETGLAELLPAQTSCVRVVATNSGGPDREDLVFRTPGKAPTGLETAFVAPRTDTTARINGRLSPEGEASFSYRFELSEDGVDWTPLPVQEGTLPAWERIVVGEELTGLHPDTTYYYRLASAENEAGSALGAGDERTFTTRTGAEVAPLSRGIELVNNPDKGNQNLFALIQYTATPPIDPSGENAIWTVTGGAPGGTASGGNTFLSQRTPSGWVSRNLVPPAAQQVGGAGLPYFPENANRDLTSFVVGVGANLNENGHTLVRLDRNQNQDVLGTFTNRVDGHRSEISEGGAHVLLVNPDNKQLEDIGGPAPELVSVMPDGQPSQCGLSTEGQSFTGAEGNGEGAGTSWNPGYRRMDAKDASRVYFEVKPDGACSGRYALYERNRETEETTLIDAGTGGVDPSLIRTTPDGRQAYFTTLSKLDLADTNSGVDVYRWDEEAGESRCLTCVVSNANIPHIGHPRAVMVSDDFSHIYFQSEEQLVAGLGVKGQLNTYVLTDESVRFVGGSAVAGGQGEGVLSNPNAQLSSDGKVLFFASAGTGGLRALTADRLPAGEECAGPVGEKEHCRELYRYDDSDGSIECISCSHDGETSFSFGSPSVSGGQNDFRISSDGSTAIFVTQQALVPSDVNQGTDIYEWHNGAVHLVTDGVRSYASGFAAPAVRGVSRDGRDVFFALAAPGLTGLEQDGLVNLYDARVGGGFVPPAPLTHCAEDSCQGPLQAPPPPPQPSSASFSGRGNAHEGQGKGRCARSKVRRGARCVSRHSHKRHRKLASHAKQGRTK